MTEPAAEVASSSPYGPRERLQLLGADQLSDADLVALILGAGTASEPVSVLAARVLASVGGAHALRGASLAHLSDLPGVGPIKAGRLLAALELGARVQRARLHPAEAIRSSADVVAALGPRLRTQQREHFVALALDAKNRPLRELLIAVGGLSACPVSPADVFRPLLREAAPAVIFVHNHPSGDPAPSTDDVTVTRRLRQAGSLLGVRVLDHVVVGDPGYFSFLDAGMLSGEA